MLETLALRLLIDSTREMKPSTIKFKFLQPVSLVPADKSMRPAEILLIDLDSKDWLSGRQRGALTLSASFQALQCDFKAK